MNDMTNTNLEANQSLRRKERIYFSQHELAERFRALPEAEQKLHGRALIDRSIEVMPKRQTRWFSILATEPPPGLEIHRRAKKGKWVVGFGSHELNRAVDWIVEAYKLGFPVFYLRSVGGYGAGLGHPCEAER
jgi:hypothetical protein